MHKLKTLTQISEQCPAQWEGTLITGQKFYARYRHGILRVYIYWEYDPFDLDPVFVWKSPTDEWLDTDKLKELTEDIIDYSRVNRSR